MDPNGDFHIWERISGVPHTECTVEAGMAATAAASYRFNSAAPYESSAILSPFLSPVPFSTSSTLISTTYLR
jgi:hypothetical protein